MTGSIGWRRIRSALRTPRAEPLWGPKCTRRRSGTQPRCPEVDRTLHLCSEDAFRMCRAARVRGRRRGRSARKTPQTGASWVRRCTASRSALRCFAGANRNRRRPPALAERVPGAQGRSGATPVTVGGKTANCRDGTRRRGTLRSSCRRRAVLELSARICYLSADRLPRGTAHLPPAGSRPQVRAPTRRWCRPA